MPNCRKVVILYVLYEYLETYFIGYIK